MVGTAIVERGVIGERGRKGRGTVVHGEFAVVLSALKERRGDNKEERGSSSRKFSSVHSISQEDVG